jgi:hypothetical protein
MAQLQGLLFFLSVFLFVCLFVFNFSSFTSLSKMHGLEQRTDGEQHWAAGWPPSGRQSSPEGQDEGGVSAGMGAEFLLVMFP